MSHVEKLDLRFLQNKTETFLVSVTHLILRFTIVQNKFKQTNKTKINHINDNHNKFEVSLHFFGNLAYCVAAATASSLFSLGVLRGSGMAFMLLAARWYSLQTSQYTVCNCIFVCCFLLMVITT